MSTNCPCGSDQHYELCCGPYHLGHHSAPSAEALMRSRYSAFVKHNSHYLIKTLHPSKRTLPLESELQALFASTCWLGLQIVSATQTQVCFIAYFRNNAQSHPEALQENSLFVFENGLWFYHSGDPKTLHQPKRNELCWCGSKKKAKKCCFRF